MSNETGEDLSKPKKIVDRSAAYPSITIEEAIAFCKSVSKSFPKEGTIITREDIAAVLKTKAPSIQRDVASVSQYGLFVKQKDGYQISPLIKILNNPLNEKERRLSIIECLKNPKLYKDLIDKFDSHALPSELHYHLVRDHEISEKAAPEASKIFIANCNFCNVLSDWGILNVEQTLSQLNNSNIQVAEVIDQEPLNEITPSNQGNVVNTLHHLAEHIEVKVHVKEEIETIRLLGKNRYAKLIYPDDISVKEIAIIKKELEMIEFRLTINE